MNKQLEKAELLFGQMYQILAHHDANTEALDAALAASGGNFDFNLLPYKPEVDPDSLQEQLAKANEREGVLSCQLESHMEYVEELEQENKEFAILIANLVRRADVKSDLYENPTYEKARETLNKFAIDNQIKGMTRVLACRELNLSEGDVDTMILMKEQLRKEQE